MYFNPSWSSRIVRAEVTRPNVAGVLASVAGGFQLGWLVKLKASKRNCNWCRSLIAVFLLREKSHSPRPGENRMLRPTLPCRNCSCGLTVSKAAIFHKLLTDRLLGMGLMPVASGKFDVSTDLRSPMPPTRKGVPSENVTMLPTCHPPMIFSSNPRRLPNGLPNPNGNSYRTDDTSRRPV